MLTVSGISTLPTMNGDWATVCRTRSATVLASAGAVVCQQHREFLAAVAGQQFVAAQHGAYPLANLVQHVVADRVAMRIVHALEAVQVDHHHRQRLAGSARPGDVAIENVDQVALVVGLGQAIGRHHLIDAFVILFLEPVGRDEFENLLPDAQPIAIAQRSGWGRPGR